MLNFIYIVVICLFISIETISIYKFFKYKRKKRAILSLIFLLLVIAVTLFFFTFRITMSEIDFLIENIKGLNVLALLTLIFQVLLIFYSIYSYIKVRMIEYEVSRSNK